ncbi:MAG: protein kinase [Bacteroidaceae bacterium]|nr:protein kinase [Bacteroidaceae bacterium]
MSSEKDKQLLPVGTELQGRYRVERQLSSGGFGNTYEVTNFRFNERWAMKEFFMKGISERDGDTSAVSVASASQPQFESQREKFNKEARRLRRLRHPGIVHVEDLFDENGTSYYVMDYIGGGSLAEAVKRHGPLSEQRVRQLLPPILDALEYVHSQQMWHLDLKPGNILLTEKGRPVLIDFGASKQLGVGGANSTSIGMTYTQGYAPSEQVDQNLDRIGPWTDLYALGATLYNLLSGNTPPMVSEIQEAEAEAFEFPKGISEQMRQLILWMMNPNRRKRPQSVAEVREFLQLAPVPADSEDVQTDETRMPDSQPEPTPPIWKKLSNAQKGAIGAAFAVVAIVLAVVLWPKSPTPLSSNEDRDSMRIAELVQVMQPTTVTSELRRSPLGDYLYTGPVDANGQPHGIGEAKFDYNKKVGLDYDHRSYKGPFVHGTMQGPDARFVMNNGDVFTGEMRDNRFYSGRYTVKEDGSYFQGSFKDGQPDQGNWYDKNGNRL